MGWYEELLEDERRKREAASGEFATGSTLLDLLGQGKAAFDEAKAEALRRMGVGVPGPYLPREAPPLGISPYTANQLEELYPGFANIPSPASKAQEDYRQTSEWQRFAQKTPAPGGKIEIKEEKADGSKVKQTNTGAPVQQPGQPGQPAWQPGMPVPPVIPMGKGVQIQNPTPWSRVNRTGAMDAPLQDTHAAGPEMTPGGGGGPYLSPEAKFLAERKAEQDKQAAMYQTVFANKYRGREARTADARAEADRFRKEKDTAIREAHPTEAAALYKAKQELLRTTSPWQRLVRNVVSMDPWYLEKDIQGRAARESARLNSMLPPTLNAIEQQEARYYNITNAEEREEEAERGIAYAHLQEMFKYNPSLAKNRKFMVDFAKAKYGYSPSLAEQFVDQHYNADTRTYDVQLHPQQEAVFHMTNNANTLLSVPGYEDVPIPVAMAMGADFAAMAKWSTDALVQLEAKSANAKTAAEKKKYDDAALRVRIQREAMAKDPNVKAYLNLMDEYERSYASYSDEGKRNWEKRRQDLETRLASVAPGQDAETLILERKKTIAEVARLYDLHEASAKERERLEGKGLTPSQKVIASYNSTYGDIVKYDKSATSTNKYVIDEGTRHQDRMSQVLSIYEGDRRKKPPNRYQADKQIAELESQSRDYYDWTTKVKRTTLTMLPPEQQKKLDNKLELDEAVYVLKRLEDIERGTEPAESLPVLIQYLKEKRDQRNVKK